MVNVIFIVLLILFLPVGEVIRIPLLPSADIKINELFALCAIVPFVVSLFSDRKILKSRLFLTFFAFIAIGFVALLINSSHLTTQEFIISLLYLARFVVYGLLLFAVMRLDAKKKKLIVNTMVLAGGIVVLFGYIQYFLYQNLRNLYYLGWDDHLYRLFATFLDPNFTGAFLVLYFLLCVGLTAFSYLNKQKNVLIFYSFLSIFSLVAIFLTYSRSAFIMLFVGITVLLVLLKKTKLILGLLAAFLVFSVISSRYFYIENINFFRVASSEARIGTALNALTIARDHPILGVGFNSYRYAQIDYGFRKGPGAIESHADAGSDNSFLFVLATTGIVGFGVYLYFWYTIIKNLILIKKKTKLKTYQYILSLVGISSIAGIFVNCLFNNSLFYPFLMEWMWILIGLTYTFSIENT